MRTTFYIRKDITVQGKHPIYLRISGGDIKLTERINIGLYVSPKLWHVKNQRVYSNGDIELEDINLILKNIESKLTSIETVYRLSEIALTPKIMRKEYENKLSRVNFVAFFKNAIPEQRPFVSASRIERYEVVLKKLTQYNEYVSFNDLNIKWLDGYRHYLKFTLKNKDNTIASNFSVIKKFLLIAVKNGIRLNFDIKDLFIGDTKGNRTYLLEHELEKCLNYYFSEFIPKNWKIILGYFLFSCMNGLRISNVQALNRVELMSNDFSIILVKGNKDKNMILNNTAKMIIEEEPELFLKKYADQHMNDELKKIMKILSINKKVTFHVARHTFATLFLKAGGKIEKLRIILGHSSVRETEIYEHITQAEANEEMFLLDKFYTKRKAAI
jgi:integrase/recombinase XerD